VFELREFRGWLKEPIPIAPFLIPLFQDEERQVPHIVRELRTFFDFLLDLVDGKTQVRVDRVVVGVRDLNGWFLHNGIECITG
jgi:hypothetical protein